MSAKQPTLEGVPAKPRRRFVMKQPRKAWLRARLLDATDECDRLRAELDAVPRWLRRIFRAG